MGSDLAYAFARAPHFAPGVEELILREGFEPRSLYEVGVNRVAPLVEALTVEQLEDIVAMFELRPFWEEFNDDSTKTDSELLLQAADAAVLFLFEKPRRDMAVVELTDVKWFLTAGMSSGDSPTDAYDPLALVGELGVFDKPITTEEVSR